MVDIICVAMDLKARYLLHVLRTAARSDHIFYLALRCTALAAFNAMIQYERYISVLRS